ncbi:MAG: alpha/beta hydrolase [Anaerolineae bacterium]
MPILSLPTLDLYYEIHGRSDAPPLVLLHGATETFEVGWKRLVAPLARRHRVIGVDLRATAAARTRPARSTCGGWRTTSPTCWTLWASTAPTSAASRAARRRRSSSAPATRRERRSLVLINNNFERDEGRQARDFWSAEAIERRDALWMKGMARWHAVAPETLLAWWAAEDRLRPAFTPDELGALYMPVLVVGGDQDPIVPLDQTVRLYQALPNAQLAILPGVGHGAPHRAAAWLDMLLGSFVDGVELDRTEATKRTNDEPAEGFDGRRADRRERSRAPAGRIGPRPGADPPGRRRGRRPGLRRAFGADPAPKRPGQGGRPAGLGPRREHALRRDAGPRPADGDDGGRHARDARRPRGGGLVGVGRGRGQALGRRGHRRGRRVHRLGGGRIRRREPFGRRRRGVGGRGRGDRPPACRRPPARVPPPHDDAAKLPGEYVARRAVLSAAAYQAWVAAREASDWPAFRPHLAVTVALAREQAEYFTYDDRAVRRLARSLRARHDVGGRWPLFGATREALVPLREAIERSGRAIDDGLVHQPFDVGAQQALAREIAEVVGYDFGAGTSGRRSIRSRPASHRTTAGSRRAGIPTS